MNSHKQEELEPESQTLLRAAPRKVEEQRQHLLAAAERKLERSRRLLQAARARASREPKHPRRKTC